MASVEESERSKDWKTQAFGSLAKTVCEDGTEHLEEALHVILDNLGRELGSVIANKDADCARSLLDIPRDVLVHLHLRQLSLTKVTGFKYWDFVSAFLSVTLDLRLVLTHVCESPKQLRRAVHDLCFHLIHNRHQVWDAILQSSSMKTKFLTQYLPDVIEKLREWCPATCSDPTKFLKFVVTLASVSRCKKVDEDRKKALKEFLFAVDTPFDFHEWFFSQSFCDVAPSTCTSRKKLIKFLFKGEVTKEQLLSLCDSTSTVSATNLNVARDDAGDYDVFFIDRRPAEDASKERDKLKEGSVEILEEQDKLEEGSVEILEEPDKDVEVADDDCDEVENDDIEEAESDDFDEVADEELHEVTDDDDIDVSSETISSHSDPAEDPVTFLRSFLAHTPDPVIIREDDCKSDGKQSPKPLKALTPRKKRAERVSSGTCEGGSDTKRAEVEVSHEALGSERPKSALAEESAFSRKKQQISPSKFREEKSARKRRKTNKASVSGEDGDPAKNEVECIDLDGSISDAETVAAGELEVPECETSTGGMEFAVKNVAEQSGAKREGKPNTAQDTASSETKSSSGSDDPGVISDTRRKSTTKEIPGNDNHPVVTVKEQPHENEDDDIAQGRVRRYSISSSDSDRSTPKPSTPSEAQKLSPRKKPSLPAKAESTDERKESVESYGKSTGRDTGETQGLDTQESSCTAPVKATKKEAGNSVRRKDVSTQTPSPRKRRKLSDQDTTDDSEHDALLLDVDNQDALKLKPPPLSPEDTAGIDLDPKPSGSLSRASTEPCTATEDQDHSLLANVGTSGSRRTEKSTDPVVDKVRAAKETTPAASSVDGSEEDERFSGLTQICVVLSDVVEGGDESPPRTGTQTKQKTPKTVGRVRSTRRSAVAARRRISEVSKMDKRLPKNTEADRTEPPSVPSCPESPRCSGNDMPNTDSEMSHTQNKTPKVTTDLSVCREKIENEKLQTESSKNTKTQRQPRRRTSSSNSETSATSEAPTLCKIARISLGKVDDLLGMAGMASTPRDTTKRTYRSTRSEARRQLPALDHCYSIPVTPTANAPAPRLGEEKAAEVCDASCHRLSASFCTSCLSVVEVTPTHDVGTMTESSPTTGKKSSSHVKKTPPAKTPSKGTTTRRSTRTNPAGYTMRLRKGPV